MSLIGGYKITIGVVVDSPHSVDHNVYDPGVFLTGQSVEKCNLFNLVSLTYNWLPTKVKCL